MGTKQIIILVVILIAVYILNKNVPLLLAVANEKKYLKDNKGLKEAAKNQKASFDLVGYNTLSQKIYEAHGWWNDDEDAVESVFQLLKTELDVSNLIDSFGIKDGKALASFLYDFLSTGEIETYINKPLRGNGVKFQF
jgi:hypothetical protein